MENDVAKAYNEASAYFVYLVGRVPRDRYDDPGLGEWNVMEFIAHTNRSHTLLVDYTEQPVALAGPDYNTPQAIAVRAGVRCGAR